MAESSSEDEDVEVRYSLDGRDIEYRFATGFIVSQPETMVYIDFVQSDPADETVRGLSRIVVLPRVADELATQLSRLRDQRESSSDGGDGPG